MIRDKQLSPRLILLGGVLGLIPVLKWVVSSRQSREAAIDRDERLERHHAASDGWIESTTGWDPSGNDLAASTPAVEDAGSRSPPARLSDSLMVERVDASRSVDAQLATLMEENDRLHEQVERLAAELAAAQERERAGDARLARIGEHLAANELRLESEWRALIEASLDGEKVAADPTRLFAPMLALLKASGVASAAKEEGGSRKDVHPEPTAPSCRVGLQFDRSVETHNDGGSVRTREYEEFAVDVLMYLEGAAAEWLGEKIHVEFGMHVDRFGDGELRLRMTTREFRAIGGSDASFSIYPDGEPSGPWLERSPWKGGEEHRPLPQAELAALRLALDPFLQELRTLGR